jgi:pSer/pThr/pTyr-binding forkhead associated (FHA) protein
VVDPQDDVIDLTCFHAYEMGVSRRHAAFELCGNCLKLHDLGSRNGTYLNGSRVSPEKAPIVRDGDELELGHLKLYVYFIMG